MKRLLGVVATLAGLQGAQTLQLTPTAPRLAKRPTARAASSSFKDDMKAVALSGLASLLLVASPMPALAKGGGHGGGGGGHSSSSYHSSSHHSSSSRPTYRSYRGTSRSTSRASSRRGRRSSSSSRGGSGSGSSWSSGSSGPPRDIVLFPDAAMARAQGGYYCPATLPRPGRRVDVLSSTSGGGTRQATVQSSVPGSGRASADGRLLQAVPGFDDDCSLLVRYDDETTETVWAAQQPEPDATPATLALGVAYGGVALFEMRGDGGGGWESALEGQEELQRKLELSGETGAENAPPSGEWWGSSQESDEGDQAVRCSLSFTSRGAVTGRGTDGVDGAYRISGGRWGALDGRDAPTVSWTEEYDEGFRVVVEGRYEPHSGRIKARFTSSRGVSGAFELAPKPSVF